MRRGEVWHVKVLGRFDRFVVIVGHDGLNDRRDDVLCVLLEEEPQVTDPLLSVAVDSPVSGYARAVTVAPLHKRNFAELRGELDTASMDQINAALRNALDL